MNFLSRSWIDLLSISTTNRSERKFVMYILPDTKSLMGSSALVQLADYLVDLLCIVARYPRVHLLITEIVACDVSLQCKKKKKRTKRTSKVSGHATEHLREIVSLVNTGTIRAAKILQDNGSYYMKQ